jgi:dihydropteroate synthase
VSGDDRSGGAGSPAPPRLVVRGVEVDLSAPVLMGIVNATPDSFSDPGRDRTTEDQVARAVELAEAGAAIVDVGGQSGVTGVAEVPAHEEAARVVPLVAGIVAAAPGVLVSVDTYRPEVVAAVLDAGAAIVNDVSGLLHPEVGARCAAAGAGLVVMHTRARPKHKVLDDALYDQAGGVVVDVVGFLAAKLGEAAAAGVAPEATIIDPGPDFAKTPRQTVEVLRAIDEVAALGRPVLLALSRKDFVGAITGRPPERRLAGTLAAVGHLAGPGTILRVHDVAATADYLAVAAALAGRRDVPEGLRLAEGLRHTRR